MMNQVFSCDLCHQEVPLAERCRDIMLFESGWAVCIHCEPGLRQRLALTMISQPVDECPILPSEARRTQHCYQEGEKWTFPHITGSVYLPAKRYWGRIDTYTASYMRWQNKAHVLAWLDSFNHQHALRPVFLDTETTGTRCFSEIIELCIVDECGLVLFRSLVNPTTEIEPMASAVHGLTYKDVKDAPRYPDIHEEVMGYLHNHVVIAYNASFDIRLLKQTADCYELAFPALHTGCLMYAYAKYREVYIEQHNGQRRCKTHRLEEAVLYEQLDMPPQHRAERDAQCVYRLFQAMKARSE
jgi:DNA polymerase III epsilon subunit-like protein